MSDLTKVSFAGLESGAAQLKSSFSALENTLNELESNLAPMVSTWDGSAREAYYVQKQKWDTAAAAMSQILQQIGTSVDTAHQSYQATESRNAGLWG